MKNISPFICIAAITAMIACANTPANSTAAVSADSISKAAVIASTTYPDTAKIGKTKIDTTVHILFTALKNKSDQEYAKIVPDEEEIEAIYLAAIPKENQEAFKKECKEKNMGEEAKKDMTQMFERAISRGNELKINWNNIVFNKITYDSSITRGIKMYSGQMTFFDGNRKFYLKFDDCLKVSSGKYIIGSVHTPYEDLTTQNTDKCTKYKAQYMKKCTAMMKKYPEGMLGSKLTPEQLRRSFKRYCSFTNKNG